MRNVIAQIAGVALLVLGAQGGIRLLFNHGDAGLLGWLPGGFVVQLLCYVLVTAIGVGLAAWGSRRVDRPGPKQ
ncbi:hypothetical protein [Arthrobacter sp. NPDC090010]|uniref:hypothetical protein n=1 Tax=Arthrobacter sp. NPDC090010 TaxID=3363942 RepID=UPI0038030598